MFGWVRRLLERQAAEVRKLTGTPLGFRVPAADKVYQQRYGDPLDLLLMGDSIAGGLGADRPSATLGARIAKKLARRTARSVRLRTTARVGAESKQLAEQLGTLEASYVPDVVVIVVGGNDVIHQTPTRVAAAQLAAAVGALEERGASVVVGTCPDLGALRQVPQPLRFLVGLRSRQLAAAQRAALRATGARVVDLARVVGPTFAEAPDEMFSPLDRFHPSSLGYRRTAKAMLPAVLSALSART